jgi:DNA-binding NtrC family response regulator
MGSDHPPATRIALAEAPAPAELARAATLDVPVLVSAASPSERSTYARLLHARSGRSEQAFVELQCGRRADSTRSIQVTNSDLKTSFLRARGGTLYLDDVAALDVLCQTWLCSQLSTELITRRVRVISGSDGSLADRVADGSFEPYLFYRLNVIHVDRNMSPPPTK